MGILVFSFASGGCQVLKKPVSLSTLTARELESDGLDALQKDDTEKAQGLFRRACSICPEDSRLRVHLAQALRRRGNLSEATREMKKAIEESVAEPTLQIELGEMYLEQGDFGQALIQSQKALDSDPRLASAWNLRGRALANAGRHDDAINSFHKSLHLNSTDEKTRFALTRSYSAIGKHRRALSNLELIAAAYPFNRQPEQLALELGSAYSNLNLDDKALEVLVSATQNPQASPEVFRELVLVQKRLGFNREAQETLVLSRKRFPQSDSLNRVSDVESDERLTESTVSGRVIR